MNKITKFSPLKFTGSVSTQTNEDLMGLSKLELLTVNNFFNQKILSDKKLNKLKGRNISFSVKKNDDITDSFSSNYPIHLRKSSQKSKIILNKDRRNKTNFLIIKEEESASKQKNKLINLIKNSSNKKSNKENNKNIRKKFPGVNFPRKININEYDKKSYKTGLLNTISNKYTWNSPERRHFYNTNNSKINLDKRKLKLNLQSLFEAKDTSSQMSSTKNVQRFFLNNNKKYTLIPKVKGYTPSKTTSNIVQDIKNEVIIFKLLCKRINKRNKDNFKKK